MSDTTDSKATISSSSRFCLFPPESYQFNDVTANIHEPTDGFMKRWIIHATRGDHSPDRITLEGAFAPRAGEEIIINSSSIVSPSDVSCVVVMEDRTIDYQGTLKFIRFNGGSNCEVDLELNITNERDAPFNRFMHLKLAATPSSSPNIANGTDSSEITFSTTDSSTSIMTSWWNTWITVGGKLHYLGQGIIPQINKSYPLNDPEHPGSVTFKVGGWAGNTPPGTLYVTRFSVADQTLSWVCEFDYEGETWRFTGEYNP